MPDAPYEITDRRPLKSRGWALSNRAARRLAAWGASANAISVGGMLAAWLAGAALAGTAVSTGPAARALWLAAAALCQLRLTANLLDGMVAVERGTAVGVGPSHAVLAAQLPADWGAQAVYDNHEVLMLHGQRCCFWRSPACGRCVLLDLCHEGRRRTGISLRAAKRLD